MKKDIAAWLGGSPKRTFKHKTKHNTSHRCRSCGFVLLRHAYQLAKTQMLAFAQIIQGIALPDLLCQGWEV